MRRSKERQCPLRDMMMPESFYQGLDPGIRFAVRVLHAAGFETCQSCQGGPDPSRPDRGHAYDHPSVDLVTTSTDAKGFGALYALYEYGLPVWQVSIVWSVKNGLPNEKLWRIEFSKTMEDRANDKPMFIHGYRAT